MSEFAGAAAEDWMMIVMVEVMPYVIPWMTKNYRMVEVMSYMIPWMTKITALDSI